MNILALLLGLGVGLGYRFLLWDQLLLKMLRKKLTQLASSDPPKLIKWAGFILGNGAEILRTGVFGLVSVVVLLPLILFANFGFSVMGITGFLAGSVGSYVTRAFGGNKDPDQLAGVFTGFWELKQVVLEVIAKENTPETRALLERLIQGKDQKSVQMVIHAIRKESGKAGIPLLQKALDHPGEEVKLLAIKSLESLDPSALAEKLPALLESRDLSIRRKAFQNIHHLKVEQAQTFLEKAMRDPDPRLRTEAAISSRRIGSGREVAKIDQLLDSGLASEYEKPLSELRNRFFAGTWSGLRATRTVLHPEADLETLAPMLQEMGQHPKRNFLIPIIRQICRNDSPEGREAIFALMGEPDKTVRAAVVQALRSLPDLDLGRLNDPLNSDKLEEREVAIQVLGGRKEPAALARLLHVAREAMAFMRQKAGPQLVPSLSEEGVLPVIEELINDNALIVRKAMYQALTSADDLRLLQIYLKALKRRKRESKLLGTGGGDTTEVPLLNQLIENLIKNQAFSGKPIGELLCRRCLTRAIEDSVSKWRIPRCRRCGYSDALLINIQSVQGIIGPEYRPPIVKEGQLQVDLWDAVSQKFRYADIDQLTLLPGDFDTDWAINAAVEGLRNGALEADPTFRIEETPGVELSTNARRLLNEIRR